MAQIRPQILGMGRSKRCEAMGSLNLAIYGRYLPLQKAGSNSTNAGRENIPVHMQVTRNRCGHVLNGTMDTVIKPVASDTLVLTVEGHIQEQCVL